MITYDYTIERDEGNEIKTYKPTVIPKKLHNLVYIKAPNSSGKSTLLHIVAIGLYGQKNDKINEALLSKMNNLANSEHQKLNASVSIENLHGDLELIAKITNGKVSLKKIVDGEKKELSFERFKNEYNLIYDLPINPTIRLRELIKEIDTFQSTYGRRVNTFNADLNKILQEILESIDPKKIEEAKSAVNDYESKLKVISNEIEIDTELLDQIQEFAYTKHYIFYKERKELLSQQINRKDHESERSVEQKKVKTQEKVKNEGVINLKIGVINRSNKEILKALDEFLPESSRSLFKKWKSLPEYKFSEIENYCDDDDFGKLNYTLAENIRDILKDISSDEKSEKIVKEGKIYLRIIQFFEDLNNNNQIDDLILPGIETKILDLINNLKEKNKENIEHIKKIQEINQTIQKLEEIITNINALRSKDFIDYKKLEKFDPSRVVERDYLEDQKWRQIESEYEAFKIKFDYYKKECKKIDLHTDASIKNEFEKLSNNSKIKKFGNYTEQQLVEEITKRINDIRKDSQEKQGLADAIRYYSDEYDKLKKKKIHPLKDRQNDIQKILDISRALEDKLLKKYDKYLEIVTHKKVSAINENDDEQMKFINQLSHYLGKRLHSVTHITEKYTVVRVDLIKDEIVVETGKIIKLGDMGTGESQATYLRGLLSTQDKRKIIALLDEVGMIDEDTLKPVINALKELYEKERLLLGIVVQKGEKGVPPQIESFT